MIKQTKTTDNELLHRSMNDGYHVVRGTVGTATPQAARFYRTVIAHDKQNISSIRTAWTTAFETVSFGLFCYTTER